MSKKHPYHHALALTLFAVVMVPCVSAAVLSDWLGSPARGGEVKLWKATDNWVEEIAAPLKDGYRVELVKGADGRKRSVYVLAEGKRP